MIAWTKEKQVLALADGWGIFSRQGGRRIIGRGDSVMRFDSDGAAQAYVAVRAINGDQLAKEAWRDIAWHYAVLDAADAEAEYDDPDYNDNGNLRAGVDDMLNELDMANVPGDQLPEMIRHWRRKPKKA